MRFAISSATILGVCVDDLIEEQDKRLDETEPDGEEAAEGALETRLTHPIGAHRRLDA